MTKEECEIETSKAIMEMRNQIAELEKENAELKDKLEVLIAVGNTCTKGLNKQLTKAKEIMREMLRILPKENIEGVYEITEEAEQFIRDVEK